MVATYDRQGIRFLYPENWEVQLDQPEPNVQCITLQSPGSGFWMLQVVGSGQSLESLASQALKSVQLDYEDVEVQEAQQDVEGTQLSGYDLQFYCLDFLIIAQLRSFSLADRHCLLLTQAEDSEFEQMTAVFLAITCSLIQRSAA